MPGLVFCGCYWGGQNMQNSSNSIQSIRQWQVSSAHVPLPYATPMLHRIGCVERSCRNKMPRLVRIGSSSLRWGETPPHNISSVCPGAYAQCVQAGRRTGGRHAHYPCGARREARRPNIAPTAITHRGHGWCAQWGRHGFVARSLRKCHFARQGKTPIFP